MATDLAKLFLSIDAMSPESAQRRWDELLAQAANVDGYYGLATWDATELQLIADKLKRRIHWKHLDLSDKEGRLNDGRSPE